MADIQLSPLRFGVCPGKPTQWATWPIVTLDSSLILHTLLLLFLPACEDFYYYPGGPSIGGLDFRCAGHVANCVPPVLRRA